MKEKIEIKQKSSPEIEEEISKKVCKRIEEEGIPVSEIDGVILKEINNSVDFSEDWQKHYSKERIKERIKEKKYNFLPATRIRRFLNLILDWVGMYIFGFIFGSILVTMGLYFIIENMNEWFLAIILSILYYVIFESIWSRTPAKFITKTRVVTEYGEKPNSNTIFIRTLVRFVPFEALSFLSPERPRGWHDRWSKTIVINDIKNTPNIQKSGFFYCSECGNKLDSDSKFCAKCGTKT